MRAPASVRSEDWVIGGLDVRVEFKDIKNIHIGVYPPEGRVRVAAPSRQDEDLLRIAIQQKIGWIKTQKFRFAAVERQTERRFVAGESHYIFGKRYRLKIESGPRNEGKLTKSYLCLTLSPQTGKSVEARKRFFESWLKSELLEKIGELCQREKLAVDLSNVAIRKMKTKWFGRQPHPEKAWLNLELAKEPEERLLEILKSLKSQS